MEKLGIEPNLLLAQIVNFAIIVLVLSKLLYRPILKILEKRKREIAAGLELTEKMRLQEEKLKAKQEEVLEEARLQGSRVIDEAKKQGGAEAKEIIAQAHLSAEEILLKAKAEAGRLHEEMSKDLRKEAVDLASNMVKRLLPEFFSEKDHHQLLAKQLRDLKKSKLI